MNPLLGANCVMAEDAMTKPKKYKYCKCKYPDMELMSDWNVWCMKCKKRHFIKGERP